MTLVWKSGLILQSPAANDPLLDLNTQPSLDLQFATSKTLDDRVSGQNLITFDRNSSGTYVDSQGVIQMAGHNLLRYSEEFDNGLWGSGAIANATTAPDGNLTADLVNITNEIGGGDARFQQALSVPLPDGDACVFSFYIKSFPGLGNQNLYAKMGRNNTTSSYPFAITEDWQRISIVDTGQTIGTTKLFFGIAAGLIAGDTAKFYIWGAQLEKSVKVSPYLKTTTSTVAAPRFDHDPTTNASLGLLVEESRTNEIPYSEDFTNSSWTNVNTSVTLNAATAPDNTLTANRLQIGATNGVIYNNTVGGVTSNSTISVWVKAVSPGTNDVFRLVSAGTLSADITATSEWVRYNFTSTSQTSSLHGIVRPANNTAADVYVWGAQFEENKTFPTSYIPTSGSTVTRAADVVSITGSNFSRWYEQSEGSWFIDYNKKLAPVNISNAGVIGPQHLYYRGNNTEQMRRFGANVIVPGIAANQNKVALAYGPSDFDISANGGAASNNLIATQTGQTTVQLMSNGTTYLTSHIARLTYYPYRLPNATLQEITS